jgi:hypothetical protein
MSEPKIVRARDGAVSRVGSLKKGMKRDFELRGPAEQAVAHLEKF